MGILAGQVALITGAGRGFGKAIAERFAQEGAAVALLARSLAQIDEVANAIRAGGGNAIGVRCDVTDAVSIEHAVTKTEELLGPIDILVNNAGGGSPIVPLLDLSDADWDATIAKNLKSTMMCTQVVGRLMRDRKRGNIVNISSLMSLGPHPTRAPYSAAKAGEAMLRTAAPGCSTADDWRKVSPPTVSTSPRTPWGAMAATRSVQPGPDATWFAPRPTTRSRLAGLATPMTVSPRRRPSWTAWVPTPPPAPIPPRSSARARSAPSSPQSRSSGGSCWRKRRGFPGFTRGARTRSRSFARPKPISPG